jgi:hypothetical protein
MSRDGPLNMVGVSNERYAYAGVSQLPLNQL